MKKYTTHNETEIDVNDTYLRGYVDCSYSTLVRLFGFPLEGDGYKTDAEWQIEFNEREVPFDPRPVATIYNWKNGYAYCGEKEGENVYDIKRWNIGGFCEAVVGRIQSLVDYEISKIK